VWIDVSVSRLRDQVFILLTISSFFLQKLFGEIGLPASCRRAFFRPVNPLPGLPWNAFSFVSSLPSYARFFLGCFARAKPCALLGISSSLWCRGHPIVWFPCSTVPWTISFFLNLSCMSWNSILVSTGVSTVFWPDITETHSSSCPHFLSSLVPN